MNTGDRQFQDLAKQAAAGAQADASRYQHAWAEGSESAIRDLDKMVRTKGIAKRDCQVIFQALGDHNRNTLAMKIMTEMAEDLPTIERPGFWQPPPRYPSQ